MSSSESLVATEVLQESIWSGRRHLIDTKDLTVDEAHHLIDLAGRYAQGGAAAVPLPAVHRGRAMANVFYENSTRTRSSFEIAGKMLGLNVVNLDVSSSSVAKGESFEDTGRSLVAMGFEVIVQRHSSSGTAHQLVGMIGDKVRIVNAGDGANEHPTQALLDAMTMLQFKKSLEGVKVAIIGDVTHSRVARSNLWLLKRLGADVHFCGPNTLMPSYLNKFANVHLRIEDAIKDADFVMVLRINHERQQSGLIPSIYEYSQIFRVDHARIALAKPDVKVMHPGPMNRDVEITNALANDPQYSVVERQVANGYFIRMAVLYTLFVHT
jgi:aspartate carbamoyltransferase catalytic subunit